MIEEKSNVTPKKPKRVLKKDFAADMHMSPRKVREIRRWADNVQIIQAKLEERPDLWEYLSKIFSDGDNKKYGISREETKYLAMLSKNELIKVLDELHFEDKTDETPEYRKGILSFYMPSHAMKTTIELPAIVNDWYKDQAKEKGISKGRLIQQLLILYYKESNKEE